MPGNRTPTADTNTEFRLGNLRKVARSDVKLLLPVPVLVATAGNEDAFTAEFRSSLFTTNRRNDKYRHHYPALTGNCLLQTITFLIRTEHGSALFLLTFTHLTTRALVAKNGVPTHLSPYDKQTKKKKNLHIHNIVLESRWHHSYSLGAANSLPLRFLRRGSR